MVLFFKAPHSLSPLICSLLTDEEVKDVSKNLKKFIARYQDEDKRVDDRRRLIERLQARKQRDDFRALLKLRHEQWLADRPERIRLGMEDPAVRTTVFEEALDLLIDEVVEVL
jgi:hypothetical protein